MKRTLLKSFLMLSLLAGAAYAQNIFPISREAGSGTRGAFVEIFKVQKELKNKKIDATSKKAEVTNSTAVMMLSVANSKNAIGYISLGSLNDTIKALKIDNVAPSVENITSKKYSISRPFNVVFTKSNPLIEDFLSYATSKEAKAVITKAGYIALEDKSFTSKKPKGKIVIAGSSSITPLMEKLKEAYEKINPNLEIQIQESDSTNGVNSVINGIADIGMVSRELKDNELSKGLTPKVLALDGLAVIVNKDNKIDNLSKEQVRDIFMGNITSWEEIK